MNINCSDECGARIAGDEEDAMRATWTHLSISNRWRCPECTATLVRAGRIAGAAPAPFVDRLPPDSIGALKKETASSIAPPTVKG